MNGSRVTHGLRAAARDQSGLTLLELLISLIIASIVSTMIFMSWFSLNNSYSYSVHSNKARDIARLAMAHMEREIRAAEAVSSSTEPGVVRSRGFWVLITTTFNTSGNSDPTMAPHLVMYRLYQDHSLWRFEDRNGNGVIANVDVNVSTDDTNFNTNEQTNGEGAQLVCRNVVNYIVPSGSETPLFEYSYYDDDGVLQLQPYVYGTANRERIIAVQIHLLVDLNPRRSPTFADLLTTAQLRNQRVF
jgi:prepilin-type N-terminal cleavage/methylation domain-containing protein